jgi:hypothetical protein
MIQTFGRWTSFVIFQPMPVASSATTDTATTTVLLPKMMPSILTNRALSLPPDSPPVSTCYVAALPKYVETSQRRVRYVSRPGKEAYMMVTHMQNGTDQLSVTIGGAFATKKGLQFVIDGRAYPMVATSTMAWLPNPSYDTRVVMALRSAIEASVVIPQYAGYPERGSTRYVYDLQGFLLGYTHMKYLCGVDASLPIARAQ